jgi:hypothetical protein
MPRYLFLSPDISILVVTTLLGRTVIIVITGLISFEWSEVREWSARLRIMLRSAETPFMMHGPDYRHRKLGNIFNR